MADLRELEEFLARVDPRTLVASTITLLVLLLGVVLQRQRPRPSRPSGPLKRGAVRVVALWKYPVKGCKGIPCEAFKVQESGAELDREWAVVRILNEKSARETGDTAQLITARQHPLLLGLQPSFSPAGNLVLTVVDKGIVTDERIEIHPKDALSTEHRSKLWGSDVTGTDCGESVAAFLCKYLKGDRFRLVRMAVALRELKADPKNGILVQDRNDVSKFSDWSPFTIASQRSLSWLNDHQEAPVNMTRFRPNIVIDGAGHSLQPFAEETWEQISVGEVNMRSTHTCGRCVMTTLRPELNGAREPHGEPLRTLRRLRAGFPHFVSKDSEDYEMEFYFSINLVHDYQPGQVIRVGDEIEVFSYKTANVSSKNNFPYLLTGKDNPHK